MDNMEDNPWLVDNLEEFLYFCCPECDERKQSKDLFLQHALNQHVKAQECLLKFRVKVEISEDILNNDTKIDENFDDNSYHFNNEETDCNVLVKNEMTTEGNDALG